MINYSSPLRWPLGCPRAKRRDYGPFLKLSPDRVLRDLEKELKQLQASNIVVTIPIAILRSGRPSCSDIGRQLPDPGVAVYLRRQKQDLVFSLDRYKTPKDNVRGLTLAIRGLRSIERYGGHGMQDRAFAGFTALPANAGQVDVHWSAVLGIESQFGIFQRGAVSRSELLAFAEAQFKKLAVAAHPDRPEGDAEVFARLSGAILNARKELASCCVARETKEAEGRRPRPDR